MRRLILFEDEWVERFLPLAWTRPTFDLRCGILTLGQAIERAVGRPASGFVVRDLLAALVTGQRALPVNQSPGPGPLLALNGRLLAPDDLAARIPLDDGPPARYLAPDGTLLAARFDGEGWDGTLAALDTLPAQPLDLPTVDWPWNLVEENAARIVHQAGWIRPGGRPAGGGVSMLGREAIFAHASAEIYPGVVIDARDGPVVIERDVTVMAHAFLQGPLHLGRGSTIKAGAQLYHGTSVGPHCKVGGEVESAILHGYSNKQHGGFLGHAYVGAWCNLGAGTTNSDLKNNYSTVRVEVGGESVDSGSRFVGFFMGDHSKTGIGVTINTGTVIGVACNLFGPGLPSKSVPSFTWGGPATGYERHRLEQALSTARTVMARRDRSLSDAEAALLTAISAAVGAA